MGPIAEATRAIGRKAQFPRTGIFAFALFQALELFAAGPGIVAGHTAVFTNPPRLVPTRSMPDGPLLGNGDVGVVLAGPPEAQQFFIGKNDFWRRPDASVMAVGCVTLLMPALQGASYRQEQDLAKAEVRGTFTKDGTTVRTRAWVDKGGFLATELKCDSTQTVEVSLRHTMGEVGAGVPRAVERTSGKTTIGRELHGGGRWYFDGSLADVTIEPRAISSAELRARAAKPPDDTAAKLFDGRATFEERAAPPIATAVTVSAWIKIASAQREANYIVSNGEWNRAYSLGLSNGRLRWAINGVFAETKESLALQRWTHVAATFDGRRMCVYVDGTLRAERGGPSDDGQIDAGRGVCSFLRLADALPSSRVVAVVSRFVGAEARTNAEGHLSATLRPGRPLFVVTPVVSDLDLHVNYINPQHLEAVAKKIATDFEAGSIADSVAAHHGRWSNFWSRSFIEIPDKEIEKRWYAALYVMGSCSAPGKVAPGLWGNWITTDHPNWHGDFHLNYNFQAPFYGVYAANHADLSLPFYQAIQESLPEGRAMAKRHGWKGVHFPVAIGPWGLRSEHPDGDWGQRSDAAFAALNFIWQYQYTQDEEFLRTTAYPYLREVGDFWEDYLKLENGRYVIYNDSIHEGSGPDFNPLLSLGLVRTLFAKLVPMSETLGVDADRRAVWRDISAKLSAFPLQQRDGKTVFRYAEKGMAWNNGNTLGIHHIFPAGAIGLDSDPKLLAVCHNTIEAMHRWADYNGFSSWYTACARVGYDPATVLAKLRTECDKHSLPNLLLYYGGGGIENCGGFLAITEMLLQSHDGTIRLFPCWPANQPARFGDLRAVGAFLVSAQIDAGVVSGVKIVSEKGRACTVLNPWPGRPARLVRNGQPAETLSGERFVFKTEPGELIEWRAP